MRAVPALSPGDLLQPALARPVLGVFLPIGLVLLLLALGVVLSLSGRGRKLRWAVGVLGVALAIWGGWALLVKPKLMIAALTAYPLSQDLRSGEPCPESIDVLATVVGKGGPERMSLALSFFGGAKTEAITPEFAQSEKESRQTFGPFKVRLPRNPPRTGVPLLLRVTSPIETSHVTVLRNAGCVPRR